MSTPTQEGGAPRAKPMRWRWEGQLRPPIGRRILGQGCRILAIAWENKDRTWSWRLHARRQVYGPHPGQKAAESAAKCAAVGEAPR